MVDLFLAALALTPFALLLGVLVGSEKRDEKRNFATSGSMLVAALLLLVGASAMNGAAMWRGIEESNGWEAVRRKTEGSILGTEVRETNERGGRHLEVAYRFSVDGVTVLGHDGSRWPGDARDLAKAHPRGTPVTVYYDVRDPSRNGLNHDTAPENPGLLATVSALCLTLNLLALWYLVGALRSPVFRTSRQPVQPLSESHREALSALARSIGKTRLAFPTAALGIAEGPWKGRRTSLALHGNSLRVSIGVASSVYLRLQLDAENELRGLPPGADALSVDTACVPLLEVEGAKLIADGGALRYLRETQARDLEEGGLLAVLEAVTRVAEALDGIEPVELIEIAAKTRPSTKRCPFCLDELETSPVSACPTCKTAHHTECLRELGRCTVRGCSGSLRRTGPEHMA